MEQFTFYELYADILQSMDDVSAGKLARCICAYEFEAGDWLLYTSDVADERSSVDIGGCRYTTKNS